MANKHLNVPNFCSTLDDLLPKFKRRRETDPLAKLVEDRPNGDASKPARPAKTRSAIAAALKAEKVRAKNSPTKGSR